jgi:trimeric autotransporter adhesin
MRCLEVRSARSLPKYAKQCLLLLLLCSLRLDTARAQIALPSPGDIGVVAGSGTNGYSGDGGAATSAKLYDPEGVAVDSSGNVYIADMENNRIREVVASTGDISTVAGNGTYGYSGDGGPATSAELKSPQGVVVDSAGNLYIADTFNSVVRKVTASTGYISTIAGDGTAGGTGDGGLATSAELQYPIFLALDSSGDLYITQHDNVDNRIRMVNASTGYINAVAGGGSGCNGRSRPYDGCLATDAILDSPEGIAVDSSGNLYIADAGYCEIREVTASTGYIYDVAGNTTCGFSGDGGAATSAEMNSPWDVAVDGSGNMYITDNGNNRIREVTESTGDIATVAGDGVNGYTGNGGAATSAELYSVEYLAVDTSDNIYLTDSTHAVVRAVAP